MRVMQDYPARNSIKFEYDSLGYRIFDDMGRRC